MVKEEDTDQRCHCSHQRSQNDTSSTFKVEVAKGRGENNPKLSIRKHRLMVLSPLQKISM
jgi:hypothetical protein